MTIKAIWLILAFLIQAVKPEPIPGVPAESGIHFQDGENWGKLSPASIAHMKAKGIDMFLETYGLTSLDLTMDYQGPQSAAQISSLKPTFYCRGAGSAKDALIVELDSKKDHRTIRTSSADATITNKGGFNKNAIRTVNVVEYSDGSFSVTPESDLKPGEYLLVFGHASTGFDFGIRKKSGRNS